MNSYSTHIWHLWHHSLNLRIANHQISTHMQWTVSWGLQLAWSSYLSGYVCCHSVISQRVNLAFFSMDWERGQKKTCNMILFIMNIWISALDVHTRCYDIYVYCEMYLHIIYILLIWEVSNLYPRSLNSHPHTVWILPCYKDGNRILPWHGPHVHAAAQGLFCLPMLSHSSSCCCARWTASSSAYRVKQQHVITYTSLTLTVPVTAIDALRHFETG